MTSMIHEDSGVANYTQISLWISKTEGEFPEVYILALMGHFLM